MYLCVFVVRFCLSLCLSVFFLAYGQVSSMTKPVRENLAIGRPFACLFYVSVFFVFCVNVSAIEYFCVFSLSFVFVIVSMFRKLTLGIVLTLAMSLCFLGAVADFHTKRWNPPSH